MHTPCINDKVKQEKSFGFHAIVEKTFMGLASSLLKVLQKAIVHKIHRENFSVSLKIRENRKTFLLLNFYRLQYMNARVRIHMYACMYIHIRKCMYGSMLVCTYVHMYICMYVHT